MRLQAKCIIYYTAYDKEIKLTLKERLFIFKCTKGIGRRGGSLIGKIIVDVSTAPSLIPVDRLLHPNTGQFTTGYPQRHYIVGYIHEVYRHFLKR